ncbi:hypothetical protein MMC34_003312 [Xylographa carneopallida]|nr:hypothetical protein [Xylographa carneopallida]
MTLRRTPYDPEYAFDQGIRELNNMNALFEPLGVLLWTATFVCMILWPNGKDFRLAFVKPPVALYRSGTVVTGVQILLSVAQCWLVIRERQFVKIHIARCHDPVVVDHGLGADNFEHVEMRPLPQRAVHPRPSIGTMSTVHGSDVHPASFV